jgi:hypothetical protein
MFFDPVNIHLFGAGDLFATERVAHQVQVLFGAVFDVLCAEDSYEKSKDRIIVLFDVE